MLEMRSTLSKRLEKLKEIAMIESIGSSCRLAGNKLSNKKVEQLVSRIQKPEVQPCQQCNGSNS